MHIYVAVTSKKKISQILESLIGTQIELEINDEAIGVAHIKLGHKNYRLTYTECHEREDGTTQGALTLVEEIKQTQPHPWRLSAIVH